MARDDYDDYGWRGRQQSPEHFGEREWRQDEWRQPDQQGYQGQGGYGQGGYGQGSYGQSGFSRGAREGSFGQGWSGQSGWQERQRQGMYGQGGYGGQGYGSRGYMGQGYGSQGGYGTQSGYGSEGGYGPGGRVAWPEQRESYGRDYSRQERGGEWDRDQEQWRGGRARQGRQGSRQGGQFAGRGPKGYKRSDDRIKEDVNEELTRHPDLDASDIEVKVENGEVTLSGTVDARQAKRLAEDLAENCSGVHEVHNHLRVRHGESASEHERGETKSKSGRSTASASS